MPSRRPPDAGVEVGGPCFVVASSRSRGEYQPIATARFADQPGRDPCGCQVASKTDDVGAKLFGGELGRRPGEADQLRRREELTGPAGEEGKQFRLATSQGQPPPRVSEHAASQVEVEARKPPQATFPEIQPQLQAPQVSFHPALIRVAKIG